MPRKDRDPELEAKIKGEIKKRSDDPCFLASEWRKHRREGLEPEEIHYDMCYIWR